MSSSLSASILDFLEPVDKLALSGDEGYRDLQIGSRIAVYETDFPQIDHADIILVGCDESGGNGGDPQVFSPSNAIRKQFYQLYHWHEEVIVADAGNIKAGATLKDSYAALKYVVKELIALGKRVVILGGSHDLTLPQYEVFASLEKIIEMTCADARIDMDIESRIPSEYFLMPLLTGQPNFVRHYNHIGFQSFLVHPAMLETIDKLRFDCYRVGTVKEDIEIMEPVIRNSHLFSFDISAIQHCYAPANRLTPNGFTGEEACRLMQFAGMSTNVKSIGIYGYDPGYDEQELTAKQISQMLWYTMDGIKTGKQEAVLSERSAFSEFHLVFAEMETVFLQSKKTGRWWMQLPDGKYIASSQYDYILACNNEIPERWLRAVERS